MAVIPNLVRTIAQINVLLRNVLLRSINNFRISLSKFSFADVAHKTEQQCGFGSALPPEESHITPGWITEL